MPARPGDPGTECRVVPAADERVAFPAIAATLGSAGSLARDGALRSGALIPPGDRGGRSHRASRHPPVVDCSFRGESSGPCRNLGSGDDLGIAWMWGISSHQEGLCNVDPEHLCGHEMERHAAAWATRAKAVEAQALASSSMVRTNARASAPVPPYADGTHRPRNPARARCSMAWCGNRRFWSTSAARGARWALPPIAWQKRRAARGSRTVLCS